MSAFCSFALLALALGQPAPALDTGLPAWNQPAEQQQLPLVGPAATVAPSSIGAGTPDIAYQRLSPQYAPPIVADPQLLSPWDRPSESSWYTRIDYFHWNEKIGGADFVNESGPLWTLGYQHRTGAERFRTELFGGVVDYHGGAQFEDGSFEPYSNTTNYLGFRVEYEYLMCPWDWPNGHFFAGIGTRFWARDLKDAVTPSGAEVWGYQEFWWTIYPYIGIETRRPTDWGAEWFSNFRVGMTPITYQHASFSDAALYPGVGLTAQAELGLRGRAVSASFFYEYMNWKRSGISQGYYQPASQEYTIGGRFGLTF